MIKCEAARLATIDGKALMLEGVRVDGSLEGALFEATVSQRFHNPHDVHVEVVYSFPLPWAAILLGVDVQIGERHLTGTVVEKLEAGARYEDAIADGNTAVMLEQNADGSFTLNLGNLAPQERCTIRLRYAQVLQLEQRGLRLLIPTVIAPRYGDPVLEGGLKLHQTLEHDVTVEYPFELSLELVGELARAHVASPSHPIGVKLAPSGDTLTVALAKSGFLDRDFVLVMSELAHDSVSVCGRDVAGSDVVTALVSFCPRIARNEGGLAVKVLVDCSGSMQGDSIAAARRALQAIIREFHADDRFALSRFGSTVEHRSRGLWRTTEATRVAAQRWAGGLNADLGGTEMEDALASTFALSHASVGDAPVDVLLITDGEIGAIDSTIAAAKASKHRVFVVGIGSSPAEGHLRRLAEVTGGASDFVAPGEAVEPAVLRMFARLRSPRLEALELEWPEGAAPLWASTPGRSVFDGDTVTVFGGFCGTPWGEVLLRGRRALQGEREVIGGATLGTVRPGDAVSRMGAAARIGALAKCQDDASQAEAVRLAVDYQLVTPRTNFLLIAERADGEKPKDMPELVKVRSMLPAGWGGAGSVMSAPVVHSPMTPLDVPAVIRCSSRRGSQDAGMGTYDIPAFLRKQADATERAVPEVSEPHHWSTCEHYTGLTPLGLAEWLRRNTQPYWPKTYADLRDIGLGEAVTDWLELVVGQNAEEEAVVLAFLSLMALPEAHADLVNKLGTLARIKAHAKRLVSQGRSTPADAPLQAQIAARLAPILEALEPEAWPPCVFELEFSLDAQNG